MTRSVAVDACPDLFEEVPADKQGLEKRMETIGNAQRYWLGVSIDAAPVSAQTVLDMRSYLTKGAGAVMMDQVSQGLSLYRESDSDRRDRLNLIVSSIAMIAAVLAVVTTAMPTIAGAFRWLVSLVRSLIP